MKPPARGGSNRGAIIRGRRRVSKHGFVICTAELRLDQPNGSKRADQSSFGAQKMQKNSMGKNVPSNPKTVLVVTAVGAITLAAGCTQAAPIVAPRTATKRMRPAVSGGPGAALLLQVFRLLRIVPVPTVFAPLPHIPVHIIKTKIIGRERANLNGRARVAVMPRGIPGLHSCDNVAEGIVRLSSCPAGIFPLCLAQ